MVPPGLCRASAPAGTVLDPDPLPILTRCHAVGGLEQPGEVGGGGQAVGGADRGDTTIDYRPVHDYTMTNDVQYIVPKARVY